MRAIQYLFLLIIVLLISCKPNSQSKEGQPINSENLLDSSGNSEGSTKQNIDSDQASYLPGSKALLASRFNSFDEFQLLVKVDYFKGSKLSDSTESKNSKVRLTYLNGGIEIISILESGISQGDIMEAKDGGFGDRIALMVNSPYAISNRTNLSKIYILARRRQDLFGEGDITFFDLAEKSVSNINTDTLAYKFEKDSSEKGYLNSFNHVTAQALITSFFSEELADFLADVHERHSMPELITGNFTTEQHNDPINFPLDNYVDIVNNELGQELGKNLNKKYKINNNTEWTSELLSNYLNDLQSYYSWSFGIGFEPFRPSDDILIRFAKKINFVLERS